MSLGNNAFVQTEGLAGKLAAAATSLHAKVKAGASSECGTTNGPHLLFADGFGTVVHSVRGTQIYTVVEAYLEYARIAAEALVRGVLPETPSAPTFSGCTRSHPGIFCFQLGPFDLEEPHLIASHSIMDALTEIITNACRSFCSGTYSHDIYFGISTPPRGPGPAAIFAWVPTLQKNRGDCSKIRTGIAEIFGARAKSGKRALYTDDEGNPILKRNGTPVTDKEQETLLRRSGWCAGSNGIIPLLWCASPNVDRKLETFPICPFVGYGKFWAEDDEEGVITQYQTYFNSLEACADPRGNEIIVPALGGMPRIEHDETGGPRAQHSHRDPLVRAIGCRAPGDPSMTTYDTLPLILLASYAGEDGAASLGELQDRFFDTCRSDTRDRFDVPALLGLMSKERFVTSDPRGLAIASAILDGLIQHNMMAEDCRIDSATSAAMNTMAAAAASRCAEDFDRDALACHHSHNYADRPHRSRRIISYYAQADTPQNFSHLFATRLWWLFINVNDAKHLVNLAEAFAAYLSHTHYIEMDKVRLNSKIYFFNGYSYKYVGAANTYLTGLLSQGSDQRPGKLRNLLNKFVARLNSLNSETQPPADSNGKGELPQGYLTSISGVYNKIVSDLGVPSYKDRLIGEILTKLDQEQTHFLGIRNRCIDDDPYVTGVKNGILEVVRIGRKRHVVFRPATQEDMAPPGINASYDPDVRGSRKWDFIEQYFHRFIENDRLREWYICFLAEAFVGKSNKVALFIQGATDSGKSVHIGHLHKFFRKPYIESIGGNTLNDPNITKDTPQPALVRAIQARLTSVEETSATIMNAGFKMLVGGEESRSSMRGMFVGGESGTIRTTFIFAVNSLPMFELLEPAIFTRSAMIRPSCRFVPKDSPLLPADPEEQERLRIFPRDDGLSSALFMNAYDAFLLLLTESFDTWTDDAGNPAGIGSFPREMNPLRDEVRRQDPYADFIGRNIIAAPGDSRMPVRELVMRFQKAYNKHGATYSAKAIVAGIGQILSSAAINGEYWQGWALIPQDRVDQEGEYQGHSLEDQPDQDQSAYPYVGVPAAYCDYREESEPGGEDSAYLMDPEEWGLRYEGAGSAGSYAGAILSP
jgi:hypothetical protein